MLPQLAAGDNNTLWVIPGELTKAIETVTEAFADHSSAGAHPVDPDDHDEELPKHEASTPALTTGEKPASGVAATADRATEMARAAVNDAKAEAAAAERATPTTS